MMSAETTLELRGAAFIHSSDRFKEIYGRVGPSVQLEAASYLFRCFDGFANVDWSAQNGRSVGPRNRTFVSIVNLSFGLRYPYQIYRDLTAYVGIGPSISRIVLTNHYSNSEKRSVYKIGVGGIIKTGVLYNLTCDWFIDGFIDYLYQPVHYTSNVDMGGFKIGAGLGYSF
jgi:outer membrane protein